MEFTLYTYEPVDDLPRLARKGFAPGSYLTSDLDTAVDGAINEEAEGNGQQAILELRVPEDLLEVSDDDIEEAILGGDGDEWEEVVDDPAAPLDPEKVAEFQAGREQGQEQHRQYSAAAQPYWDQVAAAEEQLDALYEAGYDEDSPEVQAFEQAVEQLEAAAEALRVQYMPEDEDGDDETPEQAAAREAAEEAEEKAEGERQERRIKERWPTTIKEAIELTESATLKGRLEPDRIGVRGAPLLVYTEELTPEEQAKGVWFRLSEEAMPLVRFKSPFWREFLRLLFFRK